MTRDEAIEKARRAQQRRMNSVRVSAIDCLTTAYIPVSNRAYIGGKVLVGSDGAAEIIDILTKSGFRITRDR
jgi:hypothetical protein